jgi:1-acylglycerone phosphate reductase
MLTRVRTGIYNSSKSATTAISETLRIELAPLGVRVVTALLGGISTNGNDPGRKGDIELPASSYYQKIRDILNHHYKGLQFTKKHDINVAAGHIVDDVLSGNSIFIRRGEGSSLSWICNMLFPHALLTSMLNGKSGLADLSAK